MGRGRRERGEVIYGWGTRVTVWLGSRRSATPTRARGGEGRETESTEAAGRKGIGLRSAGASWACLVILRGLTPGDRELSRNRQDNEMSSIIFFTGKEKKRVSEFRPRTTT